MALSATMLTTQIRSSSPLCHSSRPISCYSSLKITVKPTITSVAKKNKSAMEKERREERLFRFVSCLQSFFVLAVGSMVILSEVPTYQFWRWTDWLNQPNTVAQQYFHIFLCISSIVDALIILLRSRCRQVRMSTSLLVHHSVLIIGLIHSIIYGADGALILLGCLIAECANPIRHLVKLFNLWHPYGEDGSLTVVFLPFLFTRMFLVQYTARAIVPLAKLSFTKGCSFVLLLCSALSMWRFIVHNKKKIELLF